MSLNSRAVALIPTMVLSVGCSKALTESSAVKVIQTYINTQDGGIVTGDIGWLTRRLGL